MRLSMKERRLVTAVVAKRYHKATKKEKGTILGEYTELTEYNRCYAAFLLRNHGRTMRINNNTVLVEDCRKRVKRNRNRTYDEQVVRVLKRVWMIMGFMCGKRLKPALMEVIAILERYKGIEVDESYFGAKRIKRKRARGSYGKTIVFGILERNGKVYTEIVPDCSRATLQAIIRGKVEVESVIHSAKWRGYNGLVV